MNSIYVKTVLYSYANLEEVMEQIDDLVERRALMSMNDFSPCVEQCEKIIDLTYQKDVLIDLKIFCDKAFSRLSDHELDCLDYKYFKKKPKSYYVGFDAESRNYFRKQVRLLSRVAERFNKVGLTDEWFLSNALKVNFLSELLRRVKKMEDRKKKRFLQTEGFKQVA